MFPPYAWLRPILFRLDAEKANDLAMFALTHGMARLIKRPTSAPSLRQQLLGMDFVNPLGLAAGLDKDAKAIPAWERMGFGFAEMGTVPPLSQPGNPKPRLFRLEEDRAIINRFGFNSQGLDHFLQNLHAGTCENMVLGVNIGANKDSCDRIADYVRAIHRLRDHARYITINISSPNTHALRDLQKEDALDRLLTNCMEARGGKQPPLFLKIAPEVTENEAQTIAQLALRSGIDGMIIANTSLSRQGLRSPLRKEKGGLSGRPLKSIALDLLRMMAQLTERKLLLIGVGGIENGEDVWMRLRAGASLVQIYTALIYRGPGLIRDILLDLEARLKQEKIAQISDIIGADLE